MKLLIFIVFVTNCFVNAQEVSVFGAGNLESAKPYGLTPSEKVILDNKKDLSKFDNKLSNMDMNFESLSQRMDGIESIFNGDSRKLKSTTIELEKLSNSYENIKLENRNLLSEQSKNKVKIKKLERKITKLIKTIDSNYVTKKQFDELVAFLNKEISKNTSQTKSKKKKEKKYTKSKKLLLEEARQLFKKDYFTKAIPILNYLVKNKHRPAECNFYLAEIHYYRKEYKDAIHKFKTSMELYDQAKYIPKLLLHSAISFEKLNDLDNAANFYGTLIDVYPNTKEAKAAQKILEK